MNFKQRFIARNLEKELNLKDGVVVVDELSCDGCGACVIICPHSAITTKILTDEEIRKLPFKGRLKVKIKGSVKVFVNPDLCSACGLCMKQCHEFAIHKLLN